MNYPLAKELKDAGFPQKADGTVLCQHDHTPGTFTTSDCCVNAYAPTLSELIGACGDGFESLFRMNKEVWQASAHTPDGVLGMPGGIQMYQELVLGNSASGSTPEIAVAQLWLALNKPNS